MKDNFLFFFKKSSEKNLVGILSNGNDFEPNSLKFQKRFVYTLQKF